MENVSAATGGLSAIVNGQWTVVNWNLSCSESATRVKRVRMVFHRREQKTKHHTGTGSAGDWF